MEDIGSIYDDLMENAFPMTKDNTFDPKSKRVALDGTQLLSRIAQKQCESWLYGCCTPDIIAFVKKHIDNMLSKFKSVTIVFDGMVKDTPLLVKSDSAYKSFFATEGNISSSVFKTMKTFVSSHPPFPNEEFVQTLFTKLKTMYADRSDFRIMRAPFFSIAQMAYFADSGEVDMLIGNVELFSFGISSILVQNTLVENLQKQDELEFFIVKNPHKKLEQLMVNDPSTPILPLRHFHTIYAFYQEHQQDVDCSVLSLLRSCPVLKLRNGEIILEQFSTQENPSNMACSLYGHKCYFEDVLALSAGLLPPSVLRTIIHEELEMPQMLFGADIKETYATEFKNTCNFLSPLHLQIVYQALQGTNHAQKNIRVSSSDGDMPNNVPAIELDQWEIPESCAGKDCDWVKQLKELSGKSTQTSIIYTHQSAAILTKMKLLDLMGYFTHATSSNEVSSPSIFAEALLKYSDQESVKTAVLFIEACRTKTLDWDKKYNPDGESEANKAALNIFTTQVLSMLPLRLTDDPPKLATISVPVFRFNMRLRSVFMALRELNMVLALRTRTKDNPAEYLRQVTIFDDPPSPMMGYVAQEILGNKPVTSMDELKQRFPMASHLEEDLRAALKHLKMLCSVASELSEATDEDQSGSDDPPINLKQPMLKAQKIFVEAVEKFLPDVSKSKSASKFKRR